MAQVPYRGYPEQNVGEGPIRLDVPAEAFGVGAARAISKAGRDVAGAGDELFRQAVKMRELEIESEVNKAVTDNLTETGQLDNAFRQLEGKDAQDTLTNHVENLKSVREKYRNSLSSPYAQKMYDRETMRRMGYDIVNAGNYAATQLKTYDKNTRTAAQSAITDNLMSDPFNKEKQEEFEGSIKAIEDEDSRLSGIQDENTKDMKRKNVLGPQIDKVAKAMANTHPEEAMDFLERMKGNMHGAQYQQTLDEVRKRSLGVWAKQEGDRITKRGDTTKDFSLVELHQMAEETAKAIAEEKKLDPTSELALRNGIIDNIDKNASRARKELIDRNRQLNISIGQTMNQQLAGGRNPINMDEATRIDPQFRDKAEALERSQPGFGQKLEDWFKANAEQNIPWTAEREANLAKFLGSTDEERMQYNPAKMFNDGQITKGMMSRMMETQAGIERKVKMGQLIDPILTRNHQAMNDAEAFPSRTNLRANERYKWLRGAAEMRMERHATEKKAVMNVKEQDEMMKSLLEEVTTGKYDWYNPMGWLFGEGPTDRRFVIEGKEPVPVNSVEDYNKLPSGSYYIYQGKLAGPKK